MNENTLLIVVVLNDCSPGGAEKQCLLQSKALMNRGFDVILFSKKIDHSFLSKHAQDLKWTSNLRTLILSKRRLLVISYLKRDHILGMMLSILPQVKWIPYERTHPKFYLTQTNLPNLFRTSAARLYFLASSLLSYAMIVQTRSAKGYWRRFIHYRKPIHIVPNIFQAYPPSIKKPVNQCKIIMGGRLIPVKDYDLALETFYRLKERGFSYSAHIFGEGPLEKHIRDKIVYLGLSKNVFLRGYTQNFSNELKCSDVYLMTSLIEGMPNSLGEAMSRGLLCITTSFPGVNDLISPLDLDYLQVVKYRSGNSIAERIIKIWNDESIHKVLQLNNTTKIRSLFSAESVTERYAKAIAGSIND